MRRLGCIAFNVAATKISSNCTSVLEKSLNWQEEDVRSSRKVLLRENILDSHCNVWILNEDVLLS